MHESEKGGSLYVKNCESVQDRICSFGSNTIKDGAYCLISSKYTFKNYLLDSTITSSGEENPKASSNIYLNLGEMKMKSINISHSKLSKESIYYVESNYITKVTLSTFSNNTTTRNNDDAAYHLGRYPGIEFNILFCNYYENKGGILFSVIGQYTILYINNCSFYHNSIAGYFDWPSEEFQVKGCYFDISDPGRGEYNVEITENVDSIYPEYHHLCSYKYFTKLKLGKYSKKFLSSCLHLQILRSLHRVPEKGTNEIH